MGWKLSAIFINSIKQIDDVELFSNLGYKNVTPLPSKFFEEILNPKEGELYISTYKGNTILCIPTLPYLFLEETLRDEETVLIKTFPNAEISSLVLQSVVNFYGFTLIKSGNKIRAKGGSADDGVAVDFGEPLKEEIELLKKSKINRDGERVYVLDDYPNEEFTEDQLGEDFIFKMSERYLGKQIDYEDDLLFKIEFRGYSYKETIENSKQTEKIEMNTKVFRYILYLVLFFIIRFAVKYLLD